MGAALYALERFQRLGAERRCVGNHHIVSLMGVEGVRSRARARQELRFVGSRTDLRFCPDLSSSKAPLTMTACWQAARAGHSAGRTDDLAVDVVTPISFSS
jgi:hypothetical protein